MKADTKDAIDRYVEHRIPTGDFLQAVLENNLEQSFARADEVNRYDMFEIVRYIYNHTPSCCWGSKKMVKAWIENAGAES